MPSTAKLSTVLERSIPIIVLAILLFYIYAELWYAPYVGFNFSASSGEITPVFANTEVANTLQEGDRILRVGAVTWEKYSTDMRQELFDGVGAGDSLAIEIQHNGESKSIKWQIQPASLTEVRDRVVNVWWLGLFFWFTGTLTVLLVRPKDERWRLLVAFYFLTALWLVVGNNSRWRFWDSAILLRIAIWLSVPVYLHLHWIFPQPLRKLPGTVWYGIYSLCGALAVAEWFQLLPIPSYLLGFLVAVLGSICLLLIHYWLGLEQRNTVRLILISTLLAFVPITLINFAHSLHALPWYGPIGLLGLLPIPGAYFYIAYRRQLGAFELRTNRLVALYLFLLLMTTLTVVVAAMISSQGGYSPVVITASMVVALISGTFAVIAFPVFQRLVDTYVLGIPTIPTEVLERYSARIATTLNVTDLIRIVRDELPDLLLIRQSALLRRESNGTLAFIFEQGVNGNELPISLDEQPPWVRLALPLAVGDNQVGRWWIGKRDPDDYFASTEIGVLQVLANQVASSLANIEQTEQLRAIYRANVDRNEAERVHLAHILHDDVLQQMAMLALSIDPADDDPASILQFDQAYQQVTEQIRQLITDLRPAMLTYGLGAAIEEYVDSLSERAGSNATISCALSNSDGCRFAPNIEESLFRIVQQACENAYRHAQASTIQVKGEITQERVHLVVEDDGIGFEIRDGLNVPILVANKHFGLVGIQERATLIRADLSIQSTPGHGVSINLAWYPSNQSPT